MQDQELQELYEKSLIDYFRNYSWWTAEIEDLVKSLPIPNPDCTWAEVLARYGTDVSMTGVGYLWKIHNKFGRVCEVHRLSPTKVSCFRDGFLVDSGTRTAQSLALTEVIIGGAVVTTSPLEEAKEALLKAENARVFQEWAMEFPEAEVEKPETWRDRPPLL